MLKMVTNEYELTFKTEHPLETDDRFKHVESFMRNMIGAKDIKLKRVNK